MSIRKLLRTIVAVTLISVLFVTPVSAHGHHHRQTATAATATTTVTDTSCPVCTVEGCTETGRHTHDGCDYCGYDHADGYCDGTCAAIGTTTTSSGRGGGHHGCHR